MVTRIFGIVWVKRLPEFIAVLKVDSSQVNQKYYSRNKNKFLIEIQVLFKNSIDAFFHGKTTDRITIEPDFMVIRIH